MISHLHKSKSRSRISKNFTRKISSVSCILFLLFFYGCNGQSPKSEFIAKYYIGKVIPVDSTTKTLEKIKLANDWMLSLEEHDNFELTGTGKKIVGYWDVIKTDDKVSKIFLQGGGWAIYGRFDGKLIQFDKPYLMFDSLFSEITFLREKK